MALEVAPQCLAVADFRSYLNVPNLPQSAESLLYIRNRKKKKQRRIWFE